MKTYSHSKIETFEKCRLKFKYRYIDRIIPEIAKSIEAHLGDTVHKSLEWLYLQVLRGIIPGINDIISFYSEKWNENYRKNMLIVNKETKVEDYFNRGVEFLVNYYIKHQPFKDNTIATEKRIQIDSDKINNIRLIGFIDRLVHNLENDEIEIHDYKTGNTMLSKEKIENSRQLALYSLAVKEMFGQNKKVCLIWHFLAQDIMICSRKTNEELENFRKEVIELIKEIEATKEFQPTISRLCDWCEYKNICSAWNNKSKTQKTLDTFKAAEEKIEEKLEKIE